MSIKKHFVIVIVCMLVMTLSVSFFVTAATRTATIKSSTGQANIGQTVTITLGFTSGETRSFGFELTYDSSQLEFVSGSQRDLSGLPGGTPHAFVSGTGRINAGVTTSGLGSVVIGSAMSLKFKVKATATGKETTVKIAKANDGMLDPENTIITGASVTINLKPAPTTTTKKTTTTTKKTTTTTKKTTTKPKTTTTKPKTTTPKTTSSKSSTSTTTPVGTTTTVTTTAPTGPNVEFSAVRYDGAVLSVPESVPSEEKIPASFDPVETNEFGGETTVYRSATLPYTLFWLADDTGEARFYYEDDETSLYVPFFRSEWSSRYFTFSVVPEDRLPEGFELRTLEVRGEKVPAYAPAKGFYMTHLAYYDLMSKVKPDTTIPDWRHYEGETTPVTSSDTNETGNVTTTPPPDGDDPLLWQGVDVEIPDEIYLVALRMNDNEDKTLYFYDLTLDSLIRADLWLVPLARTFLDYNENAGSVTELTTIPTEPTKVSTDEPAVLGAKTVNLFGFEVPLWLLIAVGALVLVLLLLLIRGIKYAKDAREAERDFDYANAESYGGGHGRIDGIDPVHFEDMPEIDLSGDDDDPWDRLSSVNLARLEDKSSLPENAPPDVIDESEPVFVEELMDESADETMESAVISEPAENTKPALSLEGEWAKLQQAVERSSARRHGLDTGPEPAPDEDDSLMEDSVTPESAEKPDGIKEKTVIQPGMHGTRPIRRVSLRRLQGEPETEPIDGPLDEDEL